VHVLVLIIESLSSYQTTCQYQTFFHTIFTLRHITIGPTTFLNLFIFSHFLELHFPLDCRYFIFYLLICISLYSVCLFAFFRHYHLHALLFLGAFANVQEVTLSFVMSVCFSIRPHGTTSVPLDGFS